MRKINNTLSVKKAILSDKYKKKWNISMDDYHYLYCNGVKVSDTLYRFGGMPHITDEYITLIKHTESKYDNGGNNYLSGQHTIIDKHGIEKFVADKYDFLHVYGIVYLYKGKYHNIETNQLYCEASDSCNTENYLFLHNRFDKDESKKGMWKIDIFTGEYEIFN